MMCYIIYRRQYGCDPEVGRNLSKSNMQKGKPSCSTGGGGDRMAIHSQRHGVSDGKRDNHPVPRGGGGGRFSFLPGPQLENHKTAQMGGGCRRKQSTKQRRWGKGMPQKQRHILFHRGGGENTP